MDGGRAQRKSRQRAERLGAFAELRVQTAGVWRSESWGGGRAQLRSWKDPILMNGSALEVIWRKASIMHAAH